MALRRYRGAVDLLVVGPWTAAGVITYTEGAELLWIKFKLGAFLPSMPVSHQLDTETVLPGAASQSFWLDGSAWQFPDYDNVETFVDWLAHAEALARDPIVNAVLQDEPRTTPDRTVRHRFRRATGMTRSSIHQMERAQRAAALLQQGVSISDTVYRAGYFDQPHLTRALKRWIGRTPAQISQLREVGALV